MGYRLGVDLGTTFTAAVVHRPGSSSGSAPTVVSLGERAATMPSVLFLGADGQVLVGEPAERRAVTDPDRVVRRFKRRIGDETPLLMGAEGTQSGAFAAHAIAARMIALVADRVAEQEGGAPDAIAVTVPAGWGDHKKELLTTALVREGLIAVTLVSEPAAAALAYAATGRLRTGSTLAVYDFGGGTFDAALLRVETDGRFTPVGTPSGLPNLGGIDFDDAVLAYVLGTAGPQTPGVDPDDPLHVTAMTRLRRECVEAKEALSADTTATVPVLLGAAQTTVRLTRGEFEAMIAGAVEETCTCIEAALVSAGLTRKNLDRILLTGGSSRIPLVSQLLSARYPGVALERDIDPKLAVATGAVLALELDAPRVSGRHAAPAIDGIAGIGGFGQNDGDATAAAPVAVMAAISAKPARPALELENFDGDREPGTRPIVAQKRKAPTVLMAAAGVIMLGGFGLAQFGALELEFGNALPGSVLQQAKADTDSSDGSQLEVEAAEGAKSAKDAKASEGESAESSDNSAGTLSGRTEGSADSGSAGSSGSSSPAATEEADETSVADSRATKDQAAPARKPAKAGAQKATGTGAVDAAATEPAASAVAPAVNAAPEAAAPAAEAEDTSSDSGSVEFTSNDTSEAPPVAP